MPVSKAEVHRKNRENLDRDLKRIKDFEGNQGDAIVTVLGQYMDTIRKDRDRNLVFVPAASWFKAFVTHVKECVAGGTDYQIHNALIDALEEHDPEFLAPPAQDDGRDEKGRFAKKAAAQAQQEATS